MGFDIGGWMSGAGSAVDRFLGGTGGEPLPAGAQASQQVSSDGYAVDTVIPETQTTAALPEIIVNESVVTGGSDQSGDYKILDTKTSITDKEQVSDVTWKTPENINIDRADYTEIKDLGDSKTQELMKQGYAPEQALAMQRDIAKEAGNSRAVSYYQNEYDKALQSKIAISSEYHHDALKSGIPTEINPFEYTGDIAKSLIYKSQGVSNVSVAGTLKPEEGIGAKLIPQFKGSLVEDANLITKAARTGQTGDYGKLPLPFSSTLGSLDINKQQEIGIKAATSPYNEFGWKVNPNISKELATKFSPEVRQNAGFNMFYKEANLDEARKASPGLLTKDYMASILPGEKLVGRSKDEVKSVAGSVIQVGGSPTSEIVGGKVQPVTTDPTANMVAIASGKGKSFQVENEDGSMRTMYESDWNLFPQAKDAPALTMGKDTVIKSPGITAGTINDYLLPEDRVIIGNKSDFAVVVPGVTPEPKPTKSEVVINTQSVQEQVVAKPYKAPVDILAGTSGKTIGNFSMADNPWLNQVPGHYGNQPSKLQQFQLTGKVTLRKQNQSFPFMKMKSIKHNKDKVKQQEVKSHVPKPDPKVLDLSFLNKNMTPVYMGAESFKFKGVSLDSIVKPTRAHTSTKTTVNISPVLGLKKSKNTSKDVTANIKLPKTKLNVSGNINDILSNVTNPIKAIKNIKIK